MVRAAASLPQGHGELIANPPLATWRDLMAANVAQLAASSHPVGGMASSELRRLARRDALSVASDFGSECRLPLPRETSHMVVTGHQPELFHPGVWVKSILADRFASRADATALDVVVDTDTFSELQASVPCMGAHPRRCPVELAGADANVPFCSSAVPSADAVDKFVASVGERLDTLPAPSVAHHFREFARAMGEASGCVRDLGAFVTVARRIYERPLESRCAEAPMSRVARTEAFAVFAADLIIRADEVADAFNAELSAFRLRRGIRSNVQPFPDLGHQGDAVELPLWWVDGVRSPLFARRKAGRLVLLAGSTEVLSAPDEAPAIAAAILAASGFVAPRAVALTLFWRAFVADLFIHGIGGGRYDQITEGLARRLYGADLPPCVIVSLTLYLPLGGHPVTEEEVGIERAVLNRFEQNPDQMIGEVNFDSDAESDAADAMVERKAALVAAIALPGADRKALGAAIREVNGQLAALLEPVAARQREKLASLEAQLAASGILFDRTYPFFLFSPLEVADKAD